MKKTLFEIGRAAIIAGTIVMATASTALAATTAAKGGPENGGQRGGMEMMAPNGGGMDMQGQMPDGEPPEKPEGEAPDGEMTPPEKPEGEAPDGEMTPPEKPEGEAPDGEMPGGVNIDALYEQIATVEDEDTLASLKELVQAYQAAMDDQKTALDEAEEGADLSEYEDAVKEAWDALKEAMEEAGLEVDDVEFLPGGMMEKPEMADGEEINAAEDAGKAPKEQLADAPAKDETSEDEAAAPVSDGMQTKGIKSVFNKIGNWFKNIFKKS